MHPRGEGVGFKEGERFVAAFDEGFAHEPRDCHIDVILLFVAHADDDAENVVEPVRFKELEEDEDPAASFKDVDGLSEGSGEVKPFVRVLFVNAEFERIRLRPRVALLKIIVEKAHLLVRVL